MATTNGNMVQVIDTPTDFVAVALDRTAHGERMVNYRAAQQDYYTRTGGALMAFVRVYGRTAAGILTGGYNHKPYAQVAPHNRDGVTVYIDTAGPGVTPEWHAVPSSVGAPPDGIGYPRGVAVYGAKERANAYRFLGATPTTAAAPPVAPPADKDDAPPADALTYGVKVKGKAARPVAPADAVAALRADPPAVVVSRVGKGKFTAIDAGAAAALLAAFPVAEDTTANEGTENVVADKVDDAAREGATEDTTAV